MPVQETKALVFQQNSVTKALTSPLKIQVHWLAAVTQVLAQRLPVTEFALNEPELVVHWTPQQQVCSLATLPTAEPSALREPTELWAASELSTASTSKDH